VARLSINADVKIFNTQTKIKGKKGRKIIVK